MISYIYFLILVTDDFNTCLMACLLVHSDYVGKLDLKRKPENV